MFLSWHMNIKIDTHVSSRDLKEYIDTPSTAQILIPSLSALILKFFHSLIVCLWFLVSAYIKDQNSHLNHGYLDLRLRMGPKTQNEYI